MRYNSNGLTVKGAITATTLTVGDSKTANYMTYKDGKLTVRGDIVASSITADKIQGGTNENAITFTNLTVTDNSTFGGELNAAKGSFTTLSCGNASNASGNGITLGSCKIYGNSGVFNTNTADINTIYCGKIQIGVSGITLIYDTTTKALCAQYDDTQKTIVTF